MRSIKVKPGYITTALVSAFAASCLASAGYSLFHVPAPPSSHVTALVTYGTSQDTRLLASMKSAVMTLDVRAAARDAHMKAAAEAKTAAAQPVPAAPTPAATTYPTYAGDYSYAGLEAIWERNGGSAGTAAVAACIAEHESGGRASAESPTDDFGLWQIHGNPAALNPDTAARIAVQMSADGTNWSPWTTAPDCGV
jgi:Lysozyme like domain